MTSRPPDQPEQAHDPEYPIGTEVMVRVGGRNVTPREGVVDRVIWHDQDACWTYYLRCNGQAVSKRYAAEDLILVAGSP